MVHGRIAVSRQALSKWRVLVALASIVDDAEAIQGRAGG
jgi:hypothetical protein